MERLNNNTRMEFKGNSEALKIDDIVSRATNEFNKDQDTIHETPKSKQSGKKIFGAMATAAAISLGLTGCAEVQETPTTIIVEPSETTKLSTPEITVTLTPTEAPTATPTPEVKTVIEPTIEGYTNETNEETGIIKLVNNETKEVDFIFNPNVWIGDEQVGGIAVKPDKMAEILGNEVKIVMPFNINEITKETNFRLEDTVSIEVSERIGKNYNVLIAEFNGSLNFINSCIVDNNINTIDEFNGETSFKKENGEIVKIEKQVGLVPLACIEDNDDVLEMTDLYCVMNSNNVSEVKNFDQQKKYAVGEETNVEATNIMSFWSDFNIVRNTTAADVAMSPEGYVVFAYPQETTTVVTETNN